MKFLSIVAGIFSLGIFSTANAVQITEVESFNKIVDSEFHFILADLGDYGFVAGKDRVSDWISEATITLEFRDPEYGPGRDPIDAAFLSLFMDQGRFFNRATNEDWVLGAAFNQNGRLIPYLSVDDDVWLGNISVTFDLLQSRVDVPEPLPFVLLGLGLLAIRLGRFKSSN
jgi:hypothetical protein